MDRLIEDFHSLHRQRFSYANAESGVEIVTLRVTAVGRLRSAPERRAVSKPADGRRSTRRVHLGGRWQEIAVRHRSDIDSPIEGPVLIEEDYTTILVSEGWSCAVGDYGDLIARCVADNRKTDGVAR